MPKIVDEAQRRRNVAEHVLTLVARSGTDAVTYSAVAAEAKVSRGLLQHYFSSREEMLDAAGRQLRTHIDARISHALAASSAELRLHGVLCCLLPGDELAIRDMLAGQGIFARSLADSELKAQYVFARTQFAALIEGLLETVAAQPTGRAAWLSRLLTGLTREYADDVLLGQISVATAEAAIKKACQELLAVAD